MRLPRYNQPLFDPDAGFTLAEVLVAITVAVMFGLAAFATNGRLLVALKSQKETTAASMMLQERMEALRALSYSNVADSSYIGTNVIANKTTSEAPLGNLSETITVSGYVTTTGGAGYPSDGSTTNQWVRNSTYTTGHQNSTNSSLASSYNLIKADILVTWTSANGRTRTRELAAIFGIGNLGQ